METVGDRIKKLRKDFKLTQKDLASRVNVSAQVISNWERGYTSPDHDDIARFAKEFNVSADYILLGKPVVTFRSFDGDPTYIDLPFDFHPQEPDIGFRIRQERTKRHWDEMSVSTKLGIKFNKYVQIERGLEKPDNQTLAKIADLFGVSIQYLLTGTEMPTTTTVAGQDITISPEELRILEEIRKHPVMFHELTKNPERSIKDLIKMWKFIKQDMVKENDEEYFDEDIIED